MTRPTGFPRSDVENDFLRARRQQILSQLSTRLRREPDDINLVLPFDEVVSALGLRGEHSVGLKTIRLDSIVGSVDANRGFDRHFRPTSGRLRSRWERLALAQARGEPMPPIDVYRIGDLHFVKDGHHRVSIAIVNKLGVIDAYVTQIDTVISAEGIRRRGDLIIKDYERIFQARVPLPADLRARITVTDPWGLARLGENVEAWGCRLMQAERRFLEREEIARRWFDEEYVPVVHMLREADLLDKRTDAEAYMAVVGERYRLIRTHEWTDAVIEQLREQRNMR